jgi:hypothetical protein
MPAVDSRVTVAGVAVDRVRSVGRSPRAGIIGMTAVPITADTPATRLTMTAGDRIWTGTVVRRPFVPRVSA